MTQLSLFNDLTSHKDDPYVGEIEEFLYAKGTRYCIGVDEAGRGPWAGSVVASAVLFPIGELPSSLKLLNDSKKLKAQQRRALTQPIFNHALAVGVGQSEPTVIDRVNILQATFLAMKRALEDILSIHADLPIDWILIDGKQTLPYSFEIPQKAIVKGDGRSYHIAAASVIAKEVRDLQMQIAHRRHPQYHFNQHKGYGTKLHQHMIEKYGICDLHRRSFKPIARVLSEHIDINKSS